MDIFTQLPACQCKKIVIRNSIKALFSPISFLVLFALCSSGAKADYILRVKTEKNVAIKNGQLIDIFPVTGERGVIDLSARNTQWRPFLVTPANTAISNLNNPGVITYYSTASTLCQYELTPLVATQSDYQWDMGFAPPNAVALALIVTPGSCNSATNQYTASGTLSLTAAVAGTLTLTDGTSTTTVSVTAGQTSAAFSLTGLNSGTGSHTVTVSGTSYPTTSATYTAPASCTVSPCSIAVILSPGLCLSATNSYVLSGTITTTNVPTSGTLTISSGAFSSRTIALPTGNASGTFSYSGLVSDGQINMVTISYSDAACVPISATYTAPASCSVAPVCSLSATATAGICATATNTYSATVAVALTNVTAGTLTVSIPGATPISQTIAAGTPSFTAVFAGLVSDGASHTATISLPGCGTTTATFTAPASCSIAPVCSISAVVTAGLCQSATNTYSAQVVVTVNNPTTGTLSISDGTQTLTFSTTANAQNTFTATFSGLPSDGTTHTVTASLPGCSTATTTYSAPASCSVAPICSINVNTGLDMDRFDKYRRFSVVEMIGYQARHRVHNSIQG